jgi:DNA-binding NarL/FixJ family response regulator
MGTPQTRIRILIVDDHPIVLKGLEASIGAEADMEIVGEARSGPAAIDLFRETRPDVTIMDLTLTAKMNGIEAIKAIREEFPDARIIILSASKGGDDIFRAVKAGAASYLLKERLGGDLAAIIREVHAGGSPLDPEVGKRLADRVRQPSLTARETEVLRLVARGLRNKEIGRILCITEDTVQLHVQNVIAKLGVESRTQAVMEALRHGMVRME